MKNRKGFTLVELLASLVILALLMAVAAPNVLGILTRSKNEAYVEDAKKLAARAEYKIRSDTSVDKPTGTKCVVMNLGYLDNAEFNDPPNGGAYYKDRSYVRACKSGNEYVYNVQIVECKTLVDGSRTECTASGGYKGIKEKPSTSLNGEDATGKVEAFNASTFKTAGAVKDSDDVLYCDSGKTTSTTACKSATTVLEKNVD